MPPGPLTDQQHPAAVIDSIPVELLDLAPLDLPNLRSERYLGETAGVLLERFVQGDKDVILRIYRDLNEVLGLLTDSLGTDATSQALHQFMQTDPFDRLRSDLRALGNATFAGERPDQVTAKAVHDIRGGALAVLLLRLEIAGDAPFSKDELRTLFMLARDHGKIMRSAVSDLDVVRRKKDLAPQSHHVRLLLEKWQDAAIGSTVLRPIRLNVESRFDGSVTECCLESAAIDRVFYNLMANALRHSASDQLDLAIFEVPSAPGENLRFVLRNEVGGADEKQLRSLAGNDKHSRDLGALFRSGVSTTGSGLGLAIVADLVTQAFGIASEAEALRLGYYGARLLESTFTVWFHWPIARSGLGAPATTDAALDVPTDLQKPAGPLAFSVTTSARGTPVLGKPA